MSDKDSITKAYMQDNEVFADAFNYLLYDGEQVIKPEQLVPLDTTQVILPYGSDMHTVPGQRFRDVSKMAVAMADSNAAYLILGVEDESKINNAMVVKNLLYDAGQYAIQTEEAARSHRRNSDRPETSGEFLSGFYKTDKLLPVITLTIYFGADKWDAPTDLHSMLSADEHILKFVDNYHLHLISPYDISEENFGKFHTELEQALKFIKYSGDKILLDKAVNEDPAFRSISHRTAELVRVMTNTNIAFDEGKERVDMCKAIEDIRKDAKEEGIEIGVEKGRVEGIEIGEEKGILKTLAGLVKKGLLSLTQAAEEANMSISEFEAKTGLKA